MEMERFAGEVSLAEEIAEILRGRIISGQYHIGEKMTEKIISSELKVSRTPVRKAFKLLEEEGLMEYVPNKGCFARGFAKQDMRDVYAVRKAVEQIAIRWAVERITDEEIKQLSEECDLMYFYTEKKDCKKILEVNEAFHEIIYTATGSRFLGQILRSYQEYVQEARKVTVKNEENLPDICREHMEIFEAIKQRDSGKAEKLMAKHLDNSRKRAEKKWGLK